LGLIIDIIGTPNDEQRSFIKDTKALSYLKHYPEKDPKNFSELFPGASEEALDLLSKMLKFNPN